MWNNHRYPHVYVGDCDHVQPLVGAGTRPGELGRDHNKTASFQKEAKGAVAG